MGNGHWTLDIGQLDILSNTCMVGERGSLGLLHNRGGLEPI